MTQEHDIRLAYISTLLDGGYTRLLEGTENPTIGYIVGGVTEPTTMNLHTGKLKEVSVLTIAEFEEFKELWRKYDMQLDECVAPNIGVGTWVHDGAIYFDLVQHIHDLDVATKIAKERGEIAIYDCKNKKDLLL